MTTTKWPVWTLMIGALALIVFLFPQLGDLLIYDRAAIIHGEIWRLISGNLVHFSFAHLLYNLIALLIVGTIIEFHGYRFFPLLCLVSALLIGITLFILEPELHFYAGLSGVVSAAVTYLCLHGITEKGIWRWLCAATLAGLIAKTVLELGSGSSVILLMSEENFVPVPLSHLAGIVAALLLCLIFYFVFTRSIPIIIDLSINHDTSKPLPASPYQGRSLLVSPPVKGEPEGVGFK